MREKITLQQIAQELNTSKVTVSRALNNRPGISAELRKKILECAERNGYPFQRAAAAPIKALAFLVPQRFFLEFDQFYTVIYYHLNHLCQAQETMLTAAVFSPEEERTGRLPEMLHTSRFDGIFLVGDASEALIQSVMDYGAPLLFIDFSKPDRTVSHVMANNYELGYEAASLLIREGHRRIGFVGDYPNNQNICDRYLGFRKALILHELEHRPEYDIVNSDARTGLYTLNFEMPQTLPTAFICTCDMAAYYLYEKLKMMHIRIPEDVSVISFDNTDICNKMEPPLTSIEIDKQDFAALAYRQMRKQIASPSAEPRKLLVNSRLVERGSIRTCA